MKLVKAMKKLKFWSRKRHKKNHALIEPPLPPPCHCRHTSPEFQPSAPPLPLWFHPNYAQNSLSESPFGPHSGMPSSSQAEFIPQQIVPEFNSLQIPAPPAGNATSYQQYTAPNPVYGVPVMPAVRRKRAAGVLGCIVNFGRHLIRWFCPCFHVREVD
ncbi:uncharacterized protein LOC127801277 [Diospyros lotus]|uniref:uncharacterized protein LOC127801277 n=1 Tax=Diospyros lotus TaxID=55363 RepID=UPI00224E820F|nr:uncharacterized protein LOC127801277 [Diospyros lotus]